ncbi:hypothetical protein PV327_006793 [Microctonus hyperodae]|uniref:2'-phosphotransferase n=1 Tax=Microctonus hyperodae TaxID=165561 RepID=A0AA39F532_MICHY|nr:hypothetical protein PV327_006793 [Microctonus hyperodae]
MHSIVSCESYDVKHGKKLSYLLRHGAEKEGLHIKASGFVPIVQILSKFKNCTINDIKRIVENDKKQRFTLQMNDGSLEIKANQGHSIATVNELSLKLVENPDFDIIHGTYISHWPTIKIQGLSRMNRNHIHFAKDFKTNCGLRQSAEIYIFIDFKKATDDGMKFFESENGVILCDGNNKGFIEPQYFLKVIDKSNKVLLPNFQ